MRDEVVRQRVREARDRVIHSIDENGILRLASSHHNGEACSFFQPRMRGSYNVCYFVRFRGSTETAQNGNDGGHPNGGEDPNGCEADVRGDF